MTSLYCTHGWSYACLIQFYAAFVVFSFLLRKERERISLRFTLELFKHKIEDSDVIEKILNEFGTGLIQVNNSRELKCIKHKCIFMNT